MNETRGTEVAVVGLGAILPDAPDAPAFWRNVIEERYSITEVPKERWDPDLYYDPDPRAPYKTHSRIGGWVREGEWDWDPFGWHLPIPPAVSDSMEDSQKWAIACTREALADYGYPRRPLDTERTAVILGNALAGDEQFVTALRILYPEFAEELARAPALLTLPPDVRAAILEDVHGGVVGPFRDVTGDAVLGQLSNILAGRVANLFDLHGPNYTMDAACASALAAMNASVKGLADGDFDVALTGGIDGNMGPVPFVKFSKLGALSATGTRPYDEGADGFVMGEGAAVFLLKRLADAERDGDRIHAVIRGLAGSSDGRGRGLTAPNPVGQRLAVEWAWERAGLTPATVGLIEGHGTSTALGDVVEMESLNEVFGPLDLPVASIALGSAKSNIGHLKAAAGAAGLLKAVFALREKVLPPSINFDRPNPNVDWSHSPFFVNTGSRDWDVPAGGLRRAGVSAFGFGGTNFHAVLEEYVPGGSNGIGRKSFAVTEGEARALGRNVEQPVVPRSPLRGALVIGAGSTAELVTRLRSIEAEVGSGRGPVPGPPLEAELRAPERVAIDFGDGVELKEKVGLALHALSAENPAEWRALRGRGIFRASGPAPKVAFLYTGQGSQYVNMLATLRASEAVVREVFDEADRVTTPLLGKPLSRFIFVEGTDTRTLEEAEADLTQTDVTQPAVLAADLALDRLLGGFGIAPDMVMGHSLGEYAALVGAGCLTFEGAARAVSARGRAVASLAVEDRGRMAAVFAPIPEVDRILRGVDGYVIVANFNSNNQAVISGASEAVERATHAFEAAGHRVVPLPISHAFHTRIVAPASEPLRQALAALDLQPARLPIVANVSGEFYPAGPDAVSRMLDMLASQIASPVQFVKGLQTLYEAGARVFVELGPKSAVCAFVQDVLGDRMDILALSTNHPKLGDAVSFNHALCGLYAAGLGTGLPATEEAPTELRAEEPISEAPLRAEDVEERVLALVAEKTGYPQDMLDVDLDLEADLGIDTVKQAEVFASMREAYAIPRDDTVKMRDFPTLAHIIRFIEERAAVPVIEPVRQPAAAVPAAQAAPPEEVFVEEAPTELRAEEPISEAPLRAEDVEERVLALVAEKTGYPQDMLDVDLDLEADLGIDTVKQAEVFASMREAYAIPRDDTVKMRDFPTLAHIIRFIEERAAVPVIEPVRQPAAAVPAAQAAPPEEVFVEEAPTELRAEEPISEAPLRAEDVEERVLALVAEKTGYPQDMLDVDLDLEADLGIDTVKQAEVFASMREAYAIPRDDTVKMRDFPTLAHIIRFIEERAAVPVIEPVRQPAAAVPARALASLEPADALPRRVPLPVLRPSLEICKPTGVVLAPGSRVVIMPDTGGIAEELIGLLEDRGVTPLVVEDAPDAATLQQRLESWAAEGVIQGVYWLPALDEESPIGAMGPDEWRESLRRRVKLLYTTMRSLYEQIAAHGTFLVTATRLGGMHGYDGAGAVAPMGGAVTGFAKAYKRERIDPLVKTLDVEAATDPGLVAELLVQETIRDPGTVEIGYRDGLRWSVALRELPADDGQPGLPLTPETVFVVTGAAGGIVSAIVADLAAASGGIFHLLDLAPEPDPSDPDLNRFASDRDGLKRVLFDRIKARGERATPAMVERELASIERKHAALSAVEAIRSSGGTSCYHALDLTDAGAAAAVIDGIRRQHGRIDVLIHAAGIEISHLLPNKEAREFDLVFDVKADGWFNLLHAIGDMPLGATVAFTSVAGRFGNTGQTDYAAANDLLCKCTSSLRNTRPGTRGIAIDWTAWADIGMATRGSIPKVMEAAGIDMMLPMTGIPAVRRELVAGGTRGEVVIAGSLGTLTEDRDASGGLDPQLATAAVEVAGAKGPMVGSVRRMSVPEGLTVETVLDPEAQPFLWDHRMDGTALLPGVMGAEAFAELARIALPDWRVAAVEDMRFQAPFKFYRGEPRTLLLGAVFRPDGQDVVAECKLTGERTLSMQAEPQVTTHFTGNVRLTRAPLEPARIDAVALPEGAFIGAEDIYRVYFHGPSYRVLGRAWPSALGGAALGVFAEDLPPDHSPASAPLVASPRLIELCFQTIGVWELAELGRFALPRSFERVSAFGGLEARRPPLVAVVTARDGGERFDATVVDAEGTICVKLQGYRSVELPGHVAASDLRIFQTGPPPVEGPSG